MKRNSFFMLKCRSLLRPSSRVVTPCAKRLNSSFYPPPVPKVPRPRKNWHNQLKTIYGPHLDQLGGGRDVPALNTIQKIIKQWQSGKSTPQNWLLLKEALTQVLQDLDASRLLGSSLTLRVFEYANTVPDISFEERWSVIKPALLHLSQPRRDEDPTMRSESLKDRVVAPWALEHLSTASTDRCAIDRVLELEQALVDAYRQNVSQDADPRLPVPAGLLQVFIYAHYLKATSEQQQFQDVLVHFLASIRANHRFNNLTESGSLHVAFSDPSGAKPTFRIPKRDVEPLKAWVRQTELALLWLDKRGGTDGIKGRAKRWADRHSTDLIVAYWRVIVEASDVNSSVHWMQTNWEDRPSEEAYFPTEQEGDDAPYSDTTSLATVADQTVDFKSVDAIRQALDRPGFVPEVVNSFIISFLRVQDSDMVAEVERVLETRQLTRFKSFYDSLVAGHGYQKHPAGAEMVVERMRKVGIQPDVFTETLLTRAYFQAELNTEALQRTRQLLLSQRDRLVPTHLCNRLFGIMLRKSLFSQAWELLQIMPRTGPSAPNVYTVNIFLNRHLQCIERDPHGWRRALGLFQALDIDPDAASFTLMIKAMLMDPEQAGGVERAAALVKQSLAKGVKLSDRTFAVLINAYVERGTEADLDMALELLRDMERHGASANEFIYSDVIRGICRHPEYRSNHIMLDEGADQPEPSLPPNLQLVHQLLYRMQTRGIPANRTTYDALISAHLNRRTQAGVDMAVQLFHELQHGPRSLPANQTWRGPMPQTWIMMLRALTQFGQWKVARQLVDSMQGSNFEPYGQLADLVQEVKRMT